MSVRLSAEVTILARICCDADRRFPCRPIDSLHLNLYFYGPKIIKNIFSRSTSSPIGQPISLSQLL